MVTQTDNRLFRRIDKELTVRYSPQGSDAEFCTITKNISGGGARIRLLKKLNPGTFIDLEIFKPELEIAARCRGKIVWSWDSDAGIKFIDQNLLSIGKLVNYLEAESANSI